MHDNQLKDLQGWPDVETASSVVRCVKQTVTITTPTPLTPDNWDCVVANWPWLEELTFQKSLAVNDTLQAPDITTCILGGVQVWTPLSGANVDLALTPSPVRVTLDPSFVEGASRIVGLGIEIQNTTADIYKQGQVLVWRQPSAVGGAGVFKKQQITAAVEDYFLGHMQRRPPANTAQEMLIPGTRQWRAEEGAYIVGTFVGQDNPPLYTSYDVPVVYDDPLSEDVTTSNTGLVPTYNTRNVWTPVPTGGNDATRAARPCVKLNPMHMGGMHFTGLSAQSSLALTVNFYVESFPGPAEENILVLATPSAMYDPVALQLFSQALSSLPVGVTAGENGFGDWFADVVRQVSNYAYPIAKAFGFNRIAETAKGLGKAAQTNQTYMAGQSPNTKPLPIAAAPVRKKKGAKVQGKKKASVKRK